MRTVYFGQDKRLTESEEKVLTHWLEVPVQEFQSIDVSQASIRDYRCGYNDDYHHVMVTIPVSKWASAPTWGEVILATVRDIESQTSSSASLISVEFDDCWMLVEFVADEPFGGLDPYVYEDQPACVVARMIEAVVSQA